jgi:hypothetical protein
MSEDRPLTEFTAEEAEPEDSEGNAEGMAEQSTQAATTETNTRSEGDDASNRDAVEPATITYRWQPEGAACARCEATTERQWRDGDTFVCPDCKKW